MTNNNKTVHGTNFTVAIEAAEGVTTGISAADRAQTIRVASRPHAQPGDIVQPGHVFPLVAAAGGVLMRAGHTEACCDLARLAGLTPAAVLCEVMNDDGTMARLPDLLEFAARHALKVGTIASLIEHRSRNESLIERAGTRTLTTQQGDFTCSVYRDRTGGVHLALTHGRWTPGDEVLVRVHEPFSVLDLLDAGPGEHSWPLPRALAALKQSERGAAVLLNCGESADALLPRALATHSRSVRRPALPIDLRTYGIGAQILRDLGVGRMKLLGSPRRMPSLPGYGLEVTGFVVDDASPAGAARHAKR
jgi:3,4-dihydroxy 2-butanone 4-phosphate synthase/GTP cyclohydrolase II